MTAKISDGDTTWMAYFKGAVYGYIETQNKHFVLYSPSYSYSWPTALVADTRYLWIGTRGNGIIRYDKQNRCLRKIVLKFEGKEILEIESMKLVSDSFEVNKAVFTGRILRS
jgi:hypothetical protein